LTGNLPLTSSTNDPTSLAKPKSETFNQCDIIAATIQSEPAEDLPDYLCLNIVAKENISGSQIPMNEHFRLQVGHAGGNITEKREIVGVC